MRRGRVWRAAILIFLAMIWVAPAQAAKRMALIIGIGNYSYLSSLANTVRDARMLADLLNEHGFDVRLHTNLTFKGFQDAVTEFQLDSLDAQEVIVFYAGHGMTVLQDNKLVNGLAASNAKIVCATRQAEKTVDMEILLRAVAHIPKQILLFDSCRDNPISQCAPNPLSTALSGFQPVSISEARSAASPNAVDKSRSTSPSQSQRGVGSFSQPALPSTSVLVGYSTALGATAADGPAGANSPFATELANTLRAKPRVPFRQILDEVSRKLAANVGQRPWVVTDGGQPNVCLAGTGCETDAALRRRNEITATRRLAALVREKVNQSDIQTAALLALEAVPDATSENKVRKNWPKLPEGHDVLQLATDAMRRRVRVVSEEFDGRIEGIVISPTGDHIVVPGNTIKIQEAATGRVVGEIPKSGGPRAKALTFSRDGRRLVFLRGKKLLIWSIADKRPVQTMRWNYTPPITRAVFSPDQRYLAVGMGGDSFTIELYDVAAGKRVADVGGNPDSISFSRDGKYVLSKTSGKAAPLVWSITEKKRLKSPKLPSGERVHALARESAKVLTVTVDGVYRLRDARTMALFSTNSFRFEDQERRPTVRLSDDGRRAAAWLETGEVQVWDTVTGQRLAAVKPTGQWIEKAWLSPGNKYLAVGSLDDLRGDRIWIYEVDTGLLVGEPIGNGRAASPRFLAETGRVLLAEPGATPEQGPTLSLWSPGAWARGRTLAVHKRMLSTAGYSADGRWILALGADDGLRLFRARNGALMRTLRPTTGFVERKGLPPGDWKRGTEFTAVGGLPGNPSATRVAFSPFGLTNAVTGGNALAAATVIGDSSLYAHKGVSPDGRLSFDLQAQRTKPDGSLALDRLAKKEHAHIVLRDTKTGRPAHILRGHERAISSAAFAPDSSWIATSSYDGTIRIWSTKTGEQLRVIRIDGKQINGVVVSPDGTQLLADHGRQLRIFRVNWNTQTLVDKAKKTVQRCLSEQERDEYRLDPTVPAWCKRHKTSSASSR